MSDADDEITQDDVDEIYGFIASLDLDETDLSVLVCVAQDLVDADLPLPVDLVVRLDVAGFNYIPHTFH